jgi:hypothetical protein
MSDPSTPQAAESILPGPGAEAEQFAQSALRAEREAEAQSRLTIAWNSVQSFEGPGTGGEGLYSFVVHIVDLVALLTLDHRSRLDQLQPSDNFEGAAIRVYQLAKDRQNLDKIVAGLKGILERGRNGTVQEQRTWQRYFEGVMWWLRHGVMRKILGIVPPPSPPSGWRGDYPKPIDDLAALCSWLRELIERNQYLHLTPLGRRIEEKPSLSDSVNNAYVLFDKLGILTEMPPQPAEPFPTVIQETAFLRNLKRECQRLLAMKPPEAVSVLLDELGKESEKAGLSSGRNQRRKPGRPVVSDPEADQKWYDDWKASGMRTLKVFARERGLPLKEVRKAIERVQARQKRARKPPTNEHRQTPVKPA